MAGYTYNPDMHSLSSSEVAETVTEATPNLDQASPIPGPPTALVDALIGDPVPAGQPFTRIVSASGQADVPDSGV